MTEIKFRSDMTVTLVNSMAKDSDVAMAARVSTVSGTHENVVDLAKDEGLINYLMRERHGSPFEHNAFTFYIEAPIFVFREFMRHRIASYNEESGRYKQLDPVFYVPADDRPLVQVGKPGAYIFEEGTAEQSALVYDALIANSEDAYEIYEKMLEEGVAREVARMALPVNIYSSMYVTMNARSLMNFLSLRSDKQGAKPSYPQAEIATVANAMEEWFAQKMPITHAAFEKNQRVAP